MCSDWDPDLSNILESDKVTFLNWKMSDSEAVFWEKVPWSLGLEGWRSRWLFWSQTLGELRNVTKSRYDGREYGRTAVVTTLLLFGPVSLLCGTFLSNQVEWRTCAVIRLYDRHALAPQRRLICSHWFDTPITRPWYDLQRRISDGEKFHPWPHLKLSHRGGELVQDPYMQTAVWIQRGGHSSIFLSVRQLVAVPGSEPGLWPYLSDWSTSRSADICEVFPPCGASCGSSESRS